MAEEGIKTTYDLLTYDLFIYHVPIGVTITLRPTDEFYIRKRKGWKFYLEIRDRPQQRRKILTGPIQGGMVHLNISGEVKVYEQEFIVLRGGKNGR